MAGFHRETKKKNRFERALQTNRQTDRQSQRQKNSRLLAGAESTEICNNGVRYLIKLFVRCSLIEEIAFLTCMYSYGIYLLKTSNQLHFSIQTYIILLEYI